MTLGIAARNDVYFATSSHGVSMMNTKFVTMGCILTLSAAGLRAAIGQVAPVIPLNKVKDHVGQRVTACGRIVSYDKST